MHKQEYKRWLLLITLALIWGSSFILIQKALTFYSPTVVGGLRVGIAGIVLLPVLLFQFKKIPRKKIPIIALAGFLGNFVPMFLFPLAQKSVTSSTAGTLNAMVPVFVLIFGFTFFKETYKTKQIIGVILGFLGTYFLITNTSTDERGTQWVSAAYILLATAMYAASGLLVKTRLSNVPSIALSATVFGIWMLPSLGIAVFELITHEAAGNPFVWQGLGYVGILGIVGTALAMILFYKLIQLSSAVFASSVTYLMPIVAVLWGFVYDEPIGWIHLLAGSLILLGVFLTRNRKK